jgi:hypothetical protein
MSTNNPPEMLTSELTRKYEPYPNHYHQSPQPPADPSVDKYSLLLDTYAAYRALMYDIANEQLDNIQDSETVDDLKEGLCAAAVFYTAAMEEVDRWVRGPKHAAGVPSDSGLEAGLTPKLMKQARLNQFVLEQEIPSGNLTFAGAEMVKKAETLHRLFMSNKHMSDETREVVAAASLVALQYIACCYIIPTEE